MTAPAINQDDLEAVDPEWLAEMLRIAAEGGTPPELPERPDSTLIQPSRHLWRLMH